MSHLHIPDGVLPIWLVILGWAVIIGGIALTTHIADDTEHRQRIPFVGSVAALMLVAMSAEIMPLEYHVNLTVFAGALLGPLLSVPVALIVAAILAFLGHGGITVTGLNATIFAFEMVLGGTLLRIGRQHVRKDSLGKLAGGVSLLTLAASTALTVGIVACGGVHKMMGFTMVAFGLGTIGWLIEAAVTSAIVTFIARVRPSLLMPDPTEEPHMPQSGDSQTMGAKR
ncbi:MAG: energy-coupling factor ABC transporter permease [Coriobacteriia bacterium]|nr:energy-coupling factor ABC transporter permease [Coriobacteriia bacterium]